MTTRYRSFSAHLREIFGCRVQKITIDAGLTCPNRDGTVGTGGCIYCNARGSGTGDFARGLSVADQIRRGKAAMAKRYKARRFIAYFQSFSNTYAPLDRLRELYDAAMADPAVVGLSIGTRPDCVDGPTLDLIEGYARRPGRLVWIEYGLQSASDQTLARINRGHDLACFRRAVADTRGRGIRICAHVILGLPGEGRQEMIATAEELARLGLDGIKLHLLYVIRDTPLETLYRRGDYVPLGPDEYAERVCDVLERLPAGMVIQRLTGDPHPEELVAPAWALEKGRSLAAIQAALARRDTRQGRLADAAGQENPPPSPVDDPPGAQA